MDKEGVLIAIFLNNFMNNILLYYEQLNINLFLKILFAMYTIVSWEIFILLFFFMVFYKLKLQKKFISFILRKITIYLPLTDDDYQKLLGIKKDKSQKSMGIVRSCELPEYTTSTTEETYFEFDLVVLFYLCNFFILFVNEIKVLVINSFVNPVNVFTDSESGEENKTSSFNVISSFCFISYAYFMYLLLRKHVFKNGIKTHESKMFFLTFVISIILFFVIEFQMPELLGINYEKTVEIVNDRVNLIVDQIKVNFNMIISDNLITIFHVKVYFALTFAVVLAVLFRAAMRNAYFDHFLLITSEKDKSLHGFNFQKLAFSVKAKAILNILLLFLLIDPLFKNIFIGEENTKRNSLIYFSILLICFICEFVFGLYLLWYSSFLFHVQNYAEVIKFSSEPTKQNLYILRAFIRLTNSKFWDIMVHMFYIVFGPLIILIAFISRGGLLEQLTNDKVEIKRYFFENSIYVVLLASQIGKGLLSNGYLFFMLITNKIKCAIY